MRASVSPSGTGRLCPQQPAAVPGPEAGRLQRLPRGGIRDRHAVDALDLEAAQPAVRDERRERAQRRLRGGQALPGLAERWRLGVLANQRAWIREAMARDGIDRYFDVWTVSEEVGAEKPDPAIFEHALSRAGTPADRCAMVGDRLDNDVEPARRHGMTGVWLLRGEAPDEPTEDQLARADLAVRTLTEVRPALEGLGG
jgi:FMN phosphatase YigB (HAD superfamily)